MKEQLDIQELLVKAIKEGDCEVIRFLIDNGADVNKKFKSLVFGDSTIFLRNYEEDRSVFECLLDYADLSITNSDQWNLLHLLAIKSTNIYRIKSLVENKHFIPMLQQKTLHGNLPIHIAKLHFNNEIAEFFEEQLAKHENNVKNSIKKYAYAAEILYRCESWGSYHGHDFSAFSISLEEFTKNLLIEIAEYKKTRERLLGLPLIVDNITISKC